ncbi:HET-domain-containing protein [Dendrothele bispora CBS 962.96]|uniref:HET-domain-containing protein n=1 Tax=Dendrothele bispora (strain CBS 962.96) TaxID=1314807 RepID=A0A4S8MVJ0_DENBC|nr:HET-domain-containing protein [Dendrothele bispora CBS 962.96]
MNEMDLPSAGQGQAPMLSTKFKNFETLHSLVCEFCWKNLFAFDSFRKAWRGQFHEVHNHSTKVPFQEDAVFSYKTTLGQIDKSRKQGCGWCALLWAELQSNVFLTSHVDLVRVAFIPALFSNNGTLVGAQRLSVWLGKDAKELFTYPIYTDRENSCANEVVARNRALQMDSPSTFASALECIRECIDNHQSCLKPQEPQNSFFPTRVIDCTDPAKPKLYTPADVVHDFYVVLSYVWGENQPHKTTTKNIEEYQRQINTDVLPKTIKDAIWTTHACGQHYLWVDALCIVQHSREDKIREIGQIPNIFAGAYFTIIAARSSKVSEGFLHDCPRPPLAVTRLPFYCKDSSTMSTVFLEHDNIGRYDDNCESMDPIHKRAWCLEERLLSSRSLVYMTSTLRFHCQFLKVNVGNAVRQYHDLVSHRLAIDWIPAPDDPPPSPTSDKLFHYNRSTTLWDTIIANYTKRYVTNIGDKLVALAGVAQRFNERWKQSSSSNYLAGLWHDNLQHDILWHKNADDLFPRLATYRAPSWSWASVEGSVVMPKMYPREWALYEVTDYRVILISENLPFGGVTAGSLTMSAKLLPGVWKVDGVYASSPLDPGDEHKLYFSWRDSIEDINENVQLLPICWRAKAEELAGLVLSPTDSKDHYRRVGCFEDVVRGWISRDDVQNLNSQIVTIV